jgi:hypothetical protein
VGMRILNIVTSPRRERSASIAIIDSSLFDYQTEIKGLVVDTSPCAAVTPARPATSIALPPSGGTDRGEGWIVVPATRRKRSSCNGFPSPNSNGKRASGSGKRGRMDRVRRAFLASCLRQPRRAISGGRLPRPFMGEVMSHESKSLRWADKQKTAFDLAGISQRP